MDVEGVDAYVFRGDCSAEYCAHYDAADVSRQLGIVPATGTRACLSPARTTVRPLDRAAAFHAERHGGGPLRGEPHQ